MSVQVYSDRVTCLAEFLEIDPEEIHAANAMDPFTETTFLFGGHEYRVLTDEEADKACEEYILDSLWAFRAEFLAEYTVIPNKYAAEIIERLQEDCESCNDALLSLIKEDRLCDLIQDAIALDGRGHFLSSYDHEENECGKYFIYKN